MATPAELEKLNKINGHLRKCGEHGPVGRKSEFPPLPALEKEAPMTRDELIEAMALAICHADDTEAPDGTLDHPETSDWSEHLARNAFTALCDAIPGLADIIDGKAVIMPKEPTDEMLDSALEGEWTPNEIYAAMVAASPYRSKTDDR